MINYLSTWLTRRRINRAIEIRDVEELGWLLEIGIDLNYRYSGASPLFIASRRDERKLIDQLLEKGARFDFPPLSDDLLLELVHNNNFKHLEQAIPLVRKSKLDHLLVVALQNKTITMADFLMNLGAELTRDAINHFSWARSNSQTILYIKKQGGEVPEDVLESVENGNWDSPSPLKAVQTEPMIDSDIEEVETSLKLKVPNALIELFARTPDLQHYVYASAWAVISTTNNFRDGEYIPEVGDLNWKDSYLVFGSTDVGDQLYLDTLDPQPKVYLISHETIEEIEVWDSLDDWKREFQCLVERI